MRCGGGFRGVGDIEVYFVTWVSRLRYAMMPQSPLMASPLSSGFNMSNHLDLRILSTHHGLSNGIGICWCGGAWLEAEGKGEGGQDEEDGGGCLVK